MPTRKHIILLSGLFLGLFFLPFSAKAQEKILAEPLSTSASVTISGANVLCVGEDTTTLTANIPFAFQRFEWREDGVLLKDVLYGDPQYISITATHNQIFSVHVFDPFDNLLDETQRQIFIVERPTVPTRLNDTLCAGQNRDATVGMTNTTASHFLWGFDTLSSPHMVNDFCTIINNYRHHWNPGPSTDTINVHVWHQNNMNRVLRTVFTVKMSTHPLTAAYENRCYRRDSAMIEIDTIPLQLVPSETSVCVGESITLSLSGDMADILWSTGQVGGTSVSATVSEVGDTTFSVEGVITFSPDLWCHGGASVTIFGMPLPQNVRIYVDGDNTIICEGLSTRLTVYCDDCESFWWNTGEVSEFIYTWPRGRFTHTVTAFGGPNHTMCSATVPLEIIGVNCEAIYFPTAIRLSSQIGNNVWHPILEPQEGTDYWFAIFNSWGQLIFESNDVTVGWDGTHNGQSVRPGTFVFLFRLSHVHRTWERTGTITVID